MPIETPDFLEASREAAIARGFGDDPHPYMAGSLSFVCQSMFARLNPEDQRWYAEVHGGLES